MSLFTGFMTLEADGLCRVCGEPADAHNHGYCKPNDGLCHGGCGLKAMRPRSGGTLCRACYNAGKQERAA